MNRKLELAKQILDRTYCIQPKCVELAELVLAESREQLDEAANQVSPLARLERWANRAGYGLWVNIRRTQRPVNNAGWEMRFSADGHDEVTGCNGPYFRKEYEEHMHAKLRGGATLSETVTAVLDKADGIWGPVDFDDE